MALSPLVAALLLGSGGGDPPGKPVTKLPPFVTDTVFPASGGRFPIRRSRGYSPLGPLNAAMTQTPPPGEQGDTSVVFYHDPTDHVYAHEAGHMLDHRGHVADLLARVDAGREHYKHPDDYFGSSREEYIAEAFARALESGRKGFSDSTKVNKEMPGVLDIIRWLQTQPPFKKGSP